MVGESQSECCSVALVAKWWPQKCIIKRCYPQLSVISIENWTEIIHVICGRKSDQFRGKIWIKLPVFISRHLEDVAPRLMMWRQLYSPEIAMKLILWIDAFSSCQWRVWLSLSVLSVGRFLWRTWMISLIIPLIHFVFNFNPWYLMVQ